MSPRVKSSNHEPQDEVKLLEKKSSDSSISNYTGMARRPTEISIFICEDGHKFNHDDIPKSSFNTSYLKSTTSFQNPPRSKLATCCFLLAILVIATMTAIALIAGVYLRSRETAESVAAPVDNTTSVTVFTNILKQGTNFSSSESPEFAFEDNLISSPS